MKIREGLCQLSPDGRFLLYYAKKNGAGPFGGSGARAISRLPWLAALTDIEGDAWWCGAASVKSRDALSMEEQGRLWSLFPRRATYDIDRLGPGWHEATKELIGRLSPAHRQGVALAACAPIPDTELMLLAVAHARGSNWSAWLGKVQYFVLSPSRPTQAPVHLDGIRWAHPVRGGRIAATGSDATLKLMRAQSGSTAEFPVEVLFQHSLGNLEPRPGPAPAWAKSMSESPDSDTQGV